MFKKLNKKGFTLAELLVVVAIIGVLVAISIPIFTSQLEKSRDAVSVANMRAAYAEAQTLALTATKTGETAGDATATMANGKVTTVAVANVAIKSLSGNTWSNLAGELPFTAPSDPGKAGKSTITFTYDENGKITKAELSDPA